MYRIVSQLAAALSLVVLFSSHSAHAQVVAPPNAINFQGRLATPSGNPVPDGTYTIRLSFYTAATGDTRIADQTFNGVPVKNGVFAVKVDQVNGTVFNNNLYLGITLGSDAELTPRTQIVSVPYAIKSDLALTVPDASITNAKLAGSITADKFAANIFNPIAWLLNGNSGLSGTQFLGTTGSQPLIFKTNNLERVRISSGGNVGIGSNNPQRLLHLAASNPELRFQDTSGSGRTYHIGIDSATGVLNFAQTGVSNILTLQPDTGNVGIGTANPKQRLHNTGDYYGRGHIWLHAYEGDGQSGTTYIQARDDSATSNIGMILRTKQGTILNNSLILTPDKRASVNGVGYSNVTFSVNDSGLLYAIGTGGKVIGSQFVTASDARLKEHIETVPDALSTLLNLRGVTYDWNPNVPHGIKGQKERQYGFLAQEVAQVLPALVQPGLNGYKAVNYQGIIPVTVEAIKTLNARSVMQQSQISLLRKENDAVKAKNAELEAKLDMVLKRLDAVERQK